MSVQCFGVVDKNATFPRSPVVLKEHLETNESTKFSRKLKKLGICGLLDEESFNCKWHIENNINSVHASSLKREVKY